MRKILIIICILFITTACFGAKDISLTEMRDVTITILFCERAITNIPDEMGNPNMKYFKAIIDFQGTAVGGGLRVNVRDIMPVGQGRDTPYTPKETYQFIQSQFGQNVADRIKNLFIQGINVDPSQ